MVDPGSGYAADDVLSFNGGEVTLTLTDNDLLTYKPSPFATGTTISYETFDGASMKFYGTPGSDTMHHTLYVDMSGITSSDSPNLLGITGHGTALNALHAKVESKRER